MLTTSATTEFADTSVAAGSTYVYRVRAVDAAGNVGSFSNGADVTTPAGPDTEPPSVPGTLTAIAASSSEVDLSWGAATDESAVVYDLERCKGSGCTDFTVLATSATTDYADTSVAAGSTYVYRVRAVDAAGNVGSFSNSADVTTPAGPDTEPPSVPGTLTAIAASSSEVDLSWGAATDESAVVYDLERCKGSGCTDFTVLSDERDDRLRGHVGRCRLDLRLSRSCGRRGGQRRLVLERRRRDDAGGPGH